MLFYVLNNSRYLWYYINNIINDVSEINIRTKCTKRKGGLGTIYIKIEKKFTHKKIIHSNIN